MSRDYIVFALFVIFVVGIILVGSMNEKPLEVAPKINSTDLYARLQTGEKIVILDVREETEFVE